MHDSVVFRIRAKWNKFKEVCGILCKRRLSQRIKGIVYKISVRCAGCYGAENWEMRDENINRLNR